MSLFSFLRKNKQESSAEDSTFYSRAEEDSKAIRNRSRKRPDARTGKGADSSDPVLPEKKRARRRLIGAVALVLTAVVVLPMVLDSEPKPLVEDIAIQIPSKDKPSSSAASRGSQDEPVSPSAGLDPKEELIDPPTATKADPSTVSKAQQDVPATAIPKSVDTTKPHVETAKPAPDKSGTDKSAADKALSEKNTQSASKPDAKPAAKPAEKMAEKAVDTERAEAARAKAILESGVDPKAAEKKSGKFVIQVAALATKEKVNELQTKLNDAGIKSFTQKVATESGDRTRIRVGPFGSKEEAEKVRAKIVKLGLNGTLVPA